MKLRFSISYRTQWGESIHVAIRYQFDDGSAKSYNITMLTDDGETWKAETAAVESRQRRLAALSYQYQLEDAGARVLRREWNLVPRLMACDSSHDYTFNDTWRDVPLTHHLFTDAYRALHGLPVGEAIRADAMPLFRRTALFRLFAPQLEKGQALAICGSHPSLGDWNTSRYLPMQPMGQGIWTLTVNVESFHGPTDYKYVIVDAATHDFVGWEEGDNRCFSPDKMHDGEVRVLDGGFLRVSERMWRMAGVAIPVFSLRSEHSCGVGDFGDLGRLADWCHDTGMSVVQLLPVNDTTKQHSWADSYPNNIISVHALHPQYCDLEEAGPLADEDQMRAFARRRAELNNLGYCDYEAVERVKTDYLRRLYDERRPLRYVGGDRLYTADDEELASFLDDNRDWLVPYAAFCLLRDRHRTARFTDWGDDAVYSRQRAEQLCADEAAGFTFYVQYLLHRQLSAAVSHARSLGVIFMGDIPVGVSLDSAEVWANASLFHRDCQMGSMPDSANPRGQNWCFPTYNWESMEADGYRWWHRRLRHMGRYFAASRIDHVLGAFRVWEIPADCLDGQLGHFSPAMPFCGEEIEYFGLTFRHDFLVRPFINDAVVDSLFGIHANFVRDHYLQREGYGIYSLRDEVSTQRKIQALFDGKGDENSQWIRDGLCRLVTNVLFTEDSRRPGFYHPRVKAYEMPVFEALKAADRNAFMRLYNDYYYERHNALWEQMALRHLSGMLRGCRMLVCGEDLGQLPECVPHVLDALRILSLEVQTLPKRKGFDFAHLESYPYLSVATISTHDMPPMRLWWEENPTMAQRYYTSMMQKDGRHPDTLTPVLAEEIIARHLYCPSMACVIAFQDWMALDADLRAREPRGERINVPGDSFNHWSYRMHLTLEQLREADTLNKKIRLMIERSKR